MIKKLKKIFYFIIIAIAIASNFTILPNSYVLAAVTTGSAVSVTNTSTSKNNTDFIILFKDTTIDKNLENTIIDAGGKIINEFSTLGGIEVKCSPSLIPTIQENDNVQSLAPNHKIKLLNENVSTFSNSKIDATSDDLYDKYQWDIKRVTNNGQSFNIESGNHDIVVGIIDSGVDTTHPDLAANFLGGKNLVPVNFDDDSSETGDSDDITDRYGHGTNVAGFIAANGKLKGVAPNIGFKSYRVFDQDGNTNATICSSAILSAVNDDVKVINLSIGSYDLKGKSYWTNPDTGIKHYLGNDMAEYSLLKRAIKYAVKNGVTVVAAAGNEGQDCSDKKALTNYLNDTYGDQGFSYEGLTYEAPSDIKGVITVSATDKNDKITSYSNYGSKFIDIAAPGGTMSKKTTTPTMCLTTDIDSGYTWTDGTSFAAPKVSATAALIICKDKFLMPKEVTKKLRKTADKLDDGNSSQYYGAGIVNTYNAVK